MNEKKREEWVSCVGWWWGIRGRVGVGVRRGDEIGRMEGEKGGEGNPWY